MQSVFHEKNIHHCCHQEKNKKGGGIKGKWLFYLKANSKNFKLNRCYFFTLASEMTEHRIHLRWPQMKNREKDEHLPQPNPHHFLMWKNWLWGACKINFTKLILGVSDFIMPELKLLLCTMDILQFLFFTLHYPQSKTVRVGRQHIFKLEFGQGSGTKTLA